MARGAQKTALNDSQSQLELENNAARTAGGQGSQIFGLAEPAIAGMINNPGPTPAEQAAIRNSTMQGAMTPYADAADQASRAAARTGNAAGLDTALDNLAREKSAAGANAAQQAELAIMQNRQQQEQQGLQDAGQLFGTTSDTMRSLYGEGNNSIGQYNSAMKKPGILGNIFGAAAGAGSMFG